VAPENEGLQTGAARAVTGMVPLVLASIFGGPVGTTAAMASMFPQGYHSTLKEAKEAGASQEDAEAAATASAALTTATMMVPLSRVMQTIPVNLRAGLAKTLVDLGEKGVEFASFNALSTIANNYVAGQSFDPARPLLKGVPQAAAEGAIAGPLLHGMGLGVTAAGRAFPARPNVQPRPPAPPRPVVQDVLNADNLDTAINVAQQVAGAPSEAAPSAGTPIDVDAETAALATGDSADLQQAALLKLFHNTGAGTVEQTAVSTFDPNVRGGYQFRTTPAIASAGADQERLRSNAAGPSREGASGDTTITHPIEVWHPESEPDASAIPLDTVHALQDHYGQAGVNVVFFKDPNGAIPFDGSHDPSQPDTIFLSNNPNRNIAQVAGHEFTHVLQTTTLPDGTSLADLLNQQVAAGITPAGQRYAQTTFGSTAPARAAFPLGPDGDAAHADAVQAHLVNELGTDIGGEAPKFQSFLPRVIDAIQLRFGDSVAGDVLGKLLDGLKAAMETVRGLFADSGTRSQNWVTNIGEIHDTLAQMYAARFGTPVEREQAALAAMKDRAERDRFVAEPAIPPGMTRLYHGSATHGRYDGPTWFSTDRTYARDYRQAAELQYVDMPTEWVNERADPDGYGQTPAKGFTWNVELDSNVTGLRAPAAAPPVDEMSAHSGSVDNRENQQPGWGETRDATTAKALQLRRWLDQLAAERDAQAADMPQARLLTQTEAAITRPVGGDETKLPAATQTRLDQVRQQIDAVTHPTADTPEMAKVRGELATTAEAKAAAAAAYVTTPEGSPDLGRIDETMAAAIGSETAPIRMTHEIEAHIGLRQSELEGHGYANPADFVRDVAAHFGEIWSAGGDSLLLVERLQTARKEYAPSLYVLLRRSADGNAYEVQSGGVFSLTESNYLAHLLPRHDAASLR
jgi:hypothetical protein